MHTEPQLHSPRLIGLDWGTSTLRAYLFGTSGVTLQARTSPFGIMRLPELAETSKDNLPSRFEAAFERTCGDWLRQFPSLPVIAAGMIGSARGWKETLYLNLPFGLEELGRHLVSLTTATGRSIWIVPGLMKVIPPVNVMRGEETQVLGSLSSGHSDIQEQERLFCLPGTHSKWVYVVRQEVVRFTTFMTGEVYAALCLHTILSQTIDPNPRLSFDAEAFGRGVDLAGSIASEGVLSDIFTSRTLALTGALTGEQQADYLSGILIGHEIYAMTVSRAYPNSRLVRQSPITVVGEENLCLRYATALKRLGYPDVRFSREAMQRGLWEVGIQSGLIANDSVA